MLNPKLQKYADRLKELVAVGEGLRVETTSPRSSRSDYTSAPARSTNPLTYISDKPGYRAWVVNCLQILSIIFGDDSRYEKEFQNNESTSKNSCDIRVGILKAALSDLEGGFLHGQEIVIASEVFDSVLEQANYLNDKGFKDAAAVLGRTVIEDALKRLARSHGLDDTKKASVINESLKNAGVYHQPMWRQVQAWTDIGNSAAHGDFHEYDQEQVRKMLEGIGEFLANHFI